MKRAAVQSLVGLFFGLAAVSAQDVQPTCRSCPGTYVSNDELQAYIKRAIANNIVDQQVRADRKSVV